MKKLSVILLLALALVSCTQNTDEIAAGLETYREVFEEETAPVYVPPEDGTSVDGIFSEQYLFSDGKFYFKLMRPTSKLGGVSMLAYSDIETGVSGIVCQDPLCTHGKNDCQYADMDDYCFTTEPGVYYGYRFGSPASTIWLADLNNDTVKLAHTMESIFGYILGYSSGRLYFYERFEYITEDKTTITEIRISYLDHRTQKVTEVGYVPDEVMMQNPSLRFMRNDEIYYSPGDGGKTLCRADPEFKNISTVFELAQGTHQWYIDDNTDEIYYLLSDQDNLTGAVYVCRDGMSEKVELPHDNICSFSINGEKIYYTIFDPVYYGISGVSKGVAPEYATKTYDYTGGKVYAVLRDNPSAEAELVYESAGFDLDRLPDLDEFIVMGNYLYFDEVGLLREVIDGVEYLTISHASDVCKVRVGLKDGSVVRIKCE